MISIIFRFRAKATIFMGKTGKFLILLTGVQSFSESFFGCCTLDIEVENFGICFDNDGIHGDDTPAASVNHIPQSSRPIFTSDLGNNKKIGHYIEDFDPESHASAAWGQDTPVFESLCLKQEQASSCWDPFEDEEEWELAEWLVDNLGQKQTVMIFLILFCLPMSFHYF